MSELAAEIRGTERSLPDAVLLALATHPDESIAALATKECARRLVDERPRDPWVAPRGTA